MIGTSDGGFAGGVLPLTDEMQQHGARPTWLGYHPRRRCRRDGRRDRGGRRQDLDGAVRHSRTSAGSRWSPIRGRALLHHEADPARRTIRTRRATSSRPTAEPFGWNELSTTDPEAARRLLPRAVRLGQRRRHGYGREGRIPLHRPAGPNAHRRDLPKPRGRQPHWRYYFRVDDNRSGEGDRRSQGRKDPHGPMEMPGGDYIVIGIDPQGAAFALVGPRK